MTRRGSYGAGWRWARAMAAVLLVCGLASCGSDGGDNSSAGAAAAVDRSATLRFGWVVEPASLDPHAEPSVGARPYWMPLYDTLFDIGSGEVRPGLATTATTSADGLTVTVELRDGVTFRDGTPFDAEAVVASLTRAAASSSGTAAAELAVISGMRAVDPLTVELTLARPTPELTAILGGPGGAVINPRAIVEGRDLALSPGPGVGTTPYELVEFVANQRAVYKRLEGFADWKGDRDALAELQIIGITDERALLAAAQSGEVDAALVRELSTKRQAEASGLKVATYTTNGVESLTLRNTRGQLGDPRVRQALAHAVDREGVGNGFFEGDCIPSDRLFPEGSPLYAPGATVYPYDPARTAELLQQAGVTGLTLDIYTNGTAAGVELAEILQYQLGEAGVRATVVQRTGPESQTAFADGEADSRQQVPVMPPHPVQALDLWFMPEGKWKLAGPELESSGLGALRQQLSDPSLSEDERATVYQQAGEVIEEAAWVIPMCRTNRHIISRPEVQGMEDLPFVVWSNVPADLLGVSIVAKE